MVCRRTRPFKIIRTRGEEALCIIAEEDEVAEWVDVETIEIDDLSLNCSENDDADEGFPPIEDLSDWVTSPWEKNC